MAWQEILTFHWLENISWCQDINCIMCIKGPTWPFSQHQYLRVLTEIFCLWRVTYSDESAQAILYHFPGPQASLHHPHSTDILITNSRQSLILACLGGWDIGCLPQVQTKYELCSTFYKSCLYMQYCVIIDGTIDKYYISLVVYHVVTYLQSVCNIVPLPYYFLMYIVFHKVWYIYLIPACLIGPLSIGEKFLW